MDGVMRGIAATKLPGLRRHEFVPTRDPLASSAEPPTSAMSNPAPVLPYFVFVV